MKTVVSVDFCKAKFHNVQWCSIELYPRYADHPTSGLKEMTQRKGGAVLGLMVQTLYV